MTSQRTLISAFTLNYLDVDVEGVFIPGLDKKMVNILGAILGIPHSDLIGLER